MQAKDIINGKLGVITRLMYQLFIALDKKTKMNLTGVAMETMRPSGPARLGYIESDMYREVDFICGALCDLVPFLQFKKREKHSWRSVTFSSLQLY